MKGKELLKIIVDLDLYEHDLVAVTIIDGRPIDLKINDIMGSYKEGEVTLVLKQI